MRLAKENDVILFTLVPHTTHEMQPLDTAVFGPLKIYWRDACHDFMQANPGKVISKYTFSTLLNTAWMKAMVPKNIINGFRTSGVYPFNPKAVLDHDPCVTPLSSDQLSDTEPVSLRPQNVVGILNQPSVQNILRLMKYYFKEGMSRDTICTT